MHPTIEIRNQGQEIVSTTYWRTEHARRYLAYLSINAGALRLLWPGHAGDMTALLERASHAVLSRGPWPLEGVPDALELMLEDGSGAPWAAHMDARQADRLWTSADDGRALPLIVYGRGATPAGVAELGRLSCLLRRVPSLPCLKAAPLPD